MNSGGQPEYMKLKLNGSDSEVKDGITIEGLLKELDIKPEGVAFEVNFNIIKKSYY